MTGGEELNYEEQAAGKKEKGNLVHERLFVVVGVESPHLFS